ncbi:hypothetical protein HETIRDRAFT_438103, partial [Heterobasidion irregulare TC 32-1]
MSTATARAEARRKAILNRGADRLSKLTTSARGEDAPAFVHDDPPLPSLPLTPRPNLDSFLGEDSPRPPTAASRSSSRTIPDPHTSPFGAAALSSTPPDPSVWSEQQQQQLLRALLGSTEPPLSSDDAPPLDDPLLTLVSSLAKGVPNGPGSDPALPSFPMEQPKSRVERFMPIVHVVAMWCLVAFFVIWQEPQAFYAQTSSVVLQGGLMRRWASLGKSPVSADIWTVQAVPFFWAFVSLEIMLHSLRIFSGS